MRCLCGQQCGGGGDGGFIQVYMPVTFVRSPPHRASYKRRDSTGCDREIAGA